MQRRTAWRFIRLLAWIIVVILLFRARAGVDWRHLFGRAPTTGAAANTVILGGDDLAPRLIDRLLIPFCRDHPGLLVTRQGGGTNRALERVINREADLAVTARAPTPAEQELAREATGDTLVVHRLALGALVVWKGDTDHETAPAGEAALTLANLRHLALESAATGGAHLVAPDPNDGTWSAFLAVVAPGVADTFKAPDVQFVADAAGVLAAVRVDPKALGITGWMAAPEPAPGDDVQAVPITGGGPQSLPVGPTYETIGTGTYPLIHSLHVVARPGGGAAATMLLTYLVGDDGQRQIERAGFLPARRALRTVVLSTDPIGETH
ncbi:MAG TPA: substrate-binding domain-containing protein [Candidatus Eisenbacteria bacterium]